MNNERWNCSLYFFNLLIFLFNTILFSHYLIKLHTNITTINNLNCENIGFISFMILINSIISFLTINKLKIISLCTTISIFSYSIYNINNNAINECEISNNIVWLCYLYSIISNLCIIIIFIMYYIIYFTKKKIKVVVNDIDIEYIEQNLVYDVNNEPINNIYE